MYMHVPGGKVVDRRENPLILWYSNSHALTFLTKLLHSFYFTVDLGNAKGF